MELGNNGAWELWGLETMALGNCGAWELLGLGTVDRRQRETNNKRQNKRKLVFTQHFTQRLHPVKRCDLIFRFLKTFSFLIPCFEVEKQKLLILLSFFIF